MIDLPPLIFVSLEDWDDIWRRNQFLCAELSRRFPSRPILFVGVARDVSHQLRHGKRVDLSSEQAVWTVPEYPNITVMRPLKLLPNSIPVCRRINETFARAQVKRMARRLRIEKPLLWLNPHQAVHMAGKMGESALVYDITDDWTLVESFSPEEREMIRRQDRLLCSLADLVVVCSRGLEKSRRPLCRNLLLLPNGVDVAHYAANPAAEKKEARWPQPVFGYTGTLHPDRIDDDMIVTLARAYPGGSVVLIGPDYLTPAIRQKLGQQKNIVLHGPVPYARMGDFIGAFDVCIVPHRESAFTESLNPIKLWEYLACGKPIVSTNVAGFRDYAHLCRIASGPGEFVDACAMALREKDEKTADRQSEAAKHSWKSRVDCLLREIKTLKVKQ